MPSRMIIRVLRRFVVEMDYFAEDQGIENSCRF